MITLKIITPEKVFFSGEVEMVVVPGEEGDFGVLQGHAPVISSLRRGNISIYQGNTVVKEYSVQDGFAEASASSCVILTDKITEQ